MRLRTLVSVSVLTTTSSTSRCGRTDALSRMNALLQASAILRHHLDVFVNYDDDAILIEDRPEAQTEENAELKKLLNMSVNEIELSVRAANCLNNANITTVGQLAMKSEAEMPQVPATSERNL